MRDRAVAVVALVTVLRGEQMEAHTKTPWRRHRYVADRQHLQLTNSCQENQVGGSEREVNCMVHGRKVRARASNRVPRATSSIQAPLIIASPCASMKPRPELDSGPQRRCRPPAPARKRCRARHSKIRRLQRPIRKAALVRSSASGSSLPLHLIDSIPHLALLWIACRSRTCRVFACARAGFSPAKNVLTFLKNRFSSLR